MPDNINTEQAKATTPSIQITGNPDVWQLICKASDGNGYGYGYGTVQSTP